MSPKTIIHDCNGCTIRHEEERELMGRQSKEVMPWAISRARRAFPGCFGSELYPSSARPAENESNDKAVMGTVRAGLPVQRILPIQCKSSILSNPVTLHRKMYGHSSLADHCFLTGHSFLTGHPFLTGHGFLSEKFPTSKDANWKTCEALEPHAEIILRRSSICQSCRLKRVEILHNSAWFALARGNQL
jgi:hypothetical protein